MREQGAEAFHDITVYDGGSGANPDQRGNVIPDRRQVEASGVSLSGAFQTSRVIHIHIARTRPPGDELSVL